MTRSGVRCALSVWTSRFTGKNTLRHCKALQNTFFWKTGLPKNISQDLSSKRLALALLIFKSLDSDRGSLVQTRKYIRTWKHHPGSIAYYE